MRAKWASFLMASGTALILSANSSASAENIQISGVVHTADSKPIFMIQVTIYRNFNEVGHVFTAEDGKYRMSVPSGNPITVRFDTHDTLTNAADWNPSLVVNIDAQKDILLDRILAPAGEPEDEVTFIDALNGYEFGAFWEERNPSRGYAESAQRRLAMMKGFSPILEELRKELEAHFSERVHHP